MSKSLRQSGTLYIGISSGYIAGLIYSYCSVLFIAPLMKAFAIDQSQVGIVTGLSLVGLAIAPFLVSTFGRTTDPRTLVNVGFLATFVGASLFLFHPTLPALIIGRLVSGLGEGFILSAANAAAARMQKPERAFGVAQLALLSTTLVIYVAGEPLLEKLGYQAGVYILLGVSAVCLLLLWIFPLSPHHSLERSIQSQGQHTPSLLPYFGVGAGLIASYCIVLIADSMIYTFAFMLGERIGIPSMTLGASLGFANFSGLFGSMFATALGTRFGRVSSLCCALAIIAVTCFSLATTHSPQLYLALLHVESFAISFCMLYFLGLLTALDDRGRWTNYSATSISVALAAAPAIGGLIAKYNGYDAMGYAAALLVFVAWLLIIVPRRLIKPEPLPFEGSQKIV